MKMKTKCLAVGIILLSVGAYFFPAAATTPVHQTENKVYRPGGFFGLKSSIEITWDANQTEEPLIPRGSSRTVTLNVSFGIIRGVFGRLINYLLSGRLVTVQISVVDKPEWCWATFSQDTLTFCIVRNATIV